MAVSDDLRASVRGLMKDMGEPMTISRVTPGAYDPTAGAVGTSTTTCYSGVGRLGTYSDGVVGGTLIKQNDRKATFSPHDPRFVPEVNDRLTVGADVYSVMSLKPREIGGAWVSFTMQVRR